MATGAGRPWKAAFVVLTRNVPERRVYLHSMLYFLFKHFNEKHRYPVRILHEGDFDAAAQAEVRAGLRGTCGELLSFVTLDAGDFEVPSWVDRDRYARNLAAQPVPYWRDERYRMMCRFWMVKARKYVADLDYYCRMDDDAWLEAPISVDLFDVARGSGKVLLGSIVHIDCAVANYGMHEFFDGLGLLPKEASDRLFLLHPVDPGLLRQVDAPLMYDSEGKTVAYMPYMVYNNFSIMAVAFWESRAVLDVLDRIDRSGNVFYFRWGDAPVVTILANVLARDGVGLLDVRYSKRLQREAFVDGRGGVHTYMPATYDHDSSVIQKAPAPAPPA